ncbi:MAG TPA: hypothetical protein PLA94_07235, partial [Myxococcota bacterium]|nr:hypothetical protein [Myxococcota bacterium]
PPPAAAGGTTVRTGTGGRKPPSGNGNSPAPAPAPAPAAVDAAPAPGQVTISSFPVAKVYINGKFVRKGAMFGQEMDPGTYEVELVTDAGLKKSFTINVVAGQLTKKVWNFTDNAWQ